MLQPFGSMDEELQQNLSSRFADSEDAIRSFFEAEIIDWAVRIFARTRPDATVQVVKGNAANHASLFIKVGIAAMENETLVRRVSAVVVNLLVPHEADVRQPVPKEPVDATGAEIAATDAPLYSASFGRSAVLQTHAHTRNTRLECPQSVEGCVNPNFALLSTFYKTVILRFCKDPVEKAQQQRALDIAYKQYKLHPDNPVCFSEYEEAYSQMASATRIMVSHGMYPGNTNPHPAFGLAYVLNLVVDDITRDPQNYKKDADYGGD